MRSPLDHDLRSDLIATADALADAARVATLRWFRTEALLADDKSANQGIARFDPVTQADRACEDAMRAVLDRLRPHDGILGEERGSRAGDSGLTWVLDPIDGTRGFLSGTPTWGVLIAVCDDAGPIYGVIDQPYIGERFSGGMGVARFVGPHGSGRLRTRAARPLAEAIVFSTFPEIGTVAEAAAFRAVSECALLTRYGMDCYAYALLAAGQIDLVIEAGLHSYDVAAPIAVIEAAGGRVTDWQGGAVHGGGRVLAASRPELHDEVLALLASCP